MVKWGLIGLAIALAIILIVVLSTCLPKKSDNSPTVEERPPNPPSPGPPIYPAFYNDYYASVATDNEDTYSGYLLTYGDY